MHDIACFETLEIYADISDSILSLPYINVCLCVYYTHTRIIIMIITIRVTTRTVNQYLKQITAIRRAINNNCWINPNSPFVRFTSAAPVVPVCVLGYDDYLSTSKINLDP